MIHLALQDPVDAVGASHSDAPKEDVAIWWIKAG